MRRSILGLILGFIYTVSPAELPVETIPNVETLPASYPDTWVYAHDTNFFSLSDAKVVLIDVAAENRNYKGSIPSSHFPSFLAATTRPEVYVAESLYSRRMRGERTDLVTIYDKVNLAPVGEVVLPGAKRGMIVTHKNTLQFLDNEKLLLVYNFTPSTSVSVVDIENRAFLAEVGIGGCVMIYPSQQRSFGSLCNDNTMLVTHLDEKGMISKQERTPAFFDADTDPIFAKPAVIDGVYYFPSFKGMVHPVDMNAADPGMVDAWSLLQEQDRQENWRPGGWQIATAHEASGRLFMLMHPDGEDGSHKGGGTEVWVFDVDAKKRVGRIVLKEWGVSIEVTKGEHPYLAVTNGNMDLDVYSVDTGEWLRFIGGRAFETPFILHASR
ncbi:MAG: amine dehydrogenase large subunit [Gammaproteobacteria bacterium]|nr:amine dehydrogenase large subunit [Gammaproteobacteria bacterium]